RGDRMDYSLQKATELGVSRIRPVITKRGRIPGDPRRLEHRLAHWQGVIISACEQCGRNDVPRLDPVAPLDACLADTPAAAGLVLDPDAPAGLADHPAGGPVSLLIGPEGGLEDTEIAAALHHGYRAVRLGPRILRTETAGVAALAVIQ